MLVIESGRRDPGGHSTKSGGVVPKAMIFRSVQGTGHLAICIELSRGLSVKGLRLMAM